jgi:multidrug efflux pump subunit AcrA (membrane-fusion protein)
MRRWQDHDTPDKEGPMKRGVKRLFVVLIIVVIVAVLGGAAYYRYQDKLELSGGMPQFGRGDEMAVDTVTPVAVQVVKRGTISESIILNGEVVPETSVNIFSTVAGKVKEIPVQEGDRVEREQQVIFIDRSEAGMNYVLTPVESTIDGLLKDVFVEVGDYISPQIPLMQIIDMDTVEVVVHIPERDIGRVRKGLRTETEVVSYPGRIFPGRVDELSPVVDPLSRTREARIRIENRGHLLKPGMYGEVKIIIRTTSDNVLIPVAAIVEKDNAQMLFVERGGKAVLREPEIDIREGNMASVLSGVGENERVIVIGQQNIDDGDEVRVTEEM